ncbi:MAG: folate-binding protein [Verrucomicrobiota bacterium]
MNRTDTPDFHRWQPASCLRVSGEDAPTFLQGQFTNDLRRTGAGEAVYGLWLNQKGKVLADSFVLQASEQAYLLVSYFSPAELISGLLADHVVADDVVIEDLTGAVEGLTVFGGGAPAGGVPEGGWSFQGRRAREPHREFIFPRNAAAGWAAKRANETPLSAAEMARRRIAAGIPAVPADLGPAELPNEGGLETEAISYTKGCYLGQEVMARLKTMGQVRRRLVGVRGGGEPPAVPAPVFQAGRPVGELRSVAADGAGWIGLALVSLLHVQRDAGLALAIEGGPGLEFSARP